jgi:hypothetical protein
MQLLCHPHYTSADKPGIKKRLLIFRYQYVTLPGDVKNDGQVCKRWQECRQDGKIGEW